MIALDKLIPEDIDQKIYLNIKDGSKTLESFREEIYQELLDFRWLSLRAQVQCQCYEEQLVHIDKRIKESVEKAVISSGV